ncbi:proteasome endopeptidase complex, archaeal, alpha subunit [Halobacteriales archaeon QS_8_65_32]|jgi:proteasome alpha subunit|nr:MAG: proteasome endopeptidase complex, archaeal, alpha subunit [Halobacteriales archaeon QS_8_65_32]
MQSNQQQAYDRGITIFSPDGRLYQVEYAREAVKRGSASIGVRTDGGVALLADRRIRSSLMEPSSVEKLHKADDHIGIASAGHVADARQLIDFARRQAQVNRLRYEEPIGVETLTKEVTDNIQQYTQVGGARPFGVALIIGGIANGEPRLYETDPSGVPTEWKSVAIGSDRETILDHLEENYRPDADLDGAIDLALSALASAKDEPLDAEGVLLSTVDAEAGYRRRTDDEIDAALSELDLDSEDDGEDE